MNSDRSQVFQAQRAIAFSIVTLKNRELAKKRGWTLQDVADQSGVNYNTVKSYTQCDDGLNTVHLSLVYEIARAFDITIENLMEVLE
ncbi:MAG: helix-turn-helix transcriptional regulator [Fischerella sp. CENA71]|nr:helix-turn-helix transcriptional regulator [Fischerella sp. CENA71]